MAVVVSNSSYGGDNTGISIRQEGNRDGKTGLSQIIAAGFDLGSSVCHPHGHYPSPFKFPDRNQRVKRSRLWIPHAYVYQTLFVFHCQLLAYSIVRWKLKFIFFPLYRLIAGNQLGNSVFRCYSYMALYQCLSLTQGFKPGHYMKVPPRTIIIAVVYGTLVGAFVNVQVLEWVMIYNRKELFEVDPRR